jgi:hypothetical protein
MKLGIAIPPLNEEDNIALNARWRHAIIKNNLPLGAQYCVLAAK